MSRTTAIVLGLIAALALGGGWYLRQQARAADDAIDAQQAATVASRTMVAADEALNHTLAAGTSAMGTLYMWGDESQARLASAAHDVRAMTAALAADVAARDALLARSAAWFALEPDAAMSSRGSIAKIAAHQAGLRAWHAALAALADALDAGAPRATIESLRAKVMTTALVGGLGE